MAGASNRPMMLYHETHQSKLRVLHCINAVLQGPFFSDQDLTDLASSLSKTDPTLPSFDDDVDFSHIISLGGSFSLKIVPVEPKLDLENAFVCHSQGHWVCVRRVGGEWYNFNGAYDVPERLSRPGLGEHFNALLDDSWSVYAVRGDLPSECPDSSNRYGKWVPPEDARGAKKSPEEMSFSYVSSSPERFGSRGYEEDLKTAMAASLRDSEHGVAEQKSTMNVEEEVLKAAIAASLRDSEHGVAEQKSTMNVEEEVLKAAIAASLRDLEHGVVGEPAEAEEESIEPAEVGDESEKARGGDDGLGGSEG